MKYYLFTKGLTLKDIKEYPAVVLRRDSWDDFGYKTTVELSYYSSSEENRVVLGHTKILHISDSEGYTEFEALEFASLSDKYCSLGQSIEYYKNIKDLGLNDLLIDLKDCAKSDTVRNKFFELKGFGYSLIRSSRAEKILKEAKIIFKDEINVRKSNDDFSFNYQTQLINSNHSTSLDFNFKEHDILPFRINVLVGNNASGKSQILSNLALTLSGMEVEQQGKVEKQTEDYFFGDIHVVSYSPFDTFKDISQLNNGKFSKNSIKSGMLPYNFYGIRKLASIDGKNEVLLKSHVEISKEIKTGYNNIISQNRRDVYLNVLEQCLGWSVVESDPKNVIDNFNFYSSGQKILIKMITDLLSSVKEDDLILIDEPESYLHPQGVSNLYHCIVKILKETKSFCIVATHSPIIVQETPSKYINILTKIGSNIKAKRPASETLGQGLNSIINEVFKVDFDGLNFFETLQAFKEAGLSIDDLEATLGNKLDFSARSYFLSL
ncbi:MAG: ATP-binding protein [Gammaproteobacteria bacterium]|nr:ATP-binding protein [Gammaproteobacteria bacterium]MBU2239564.1 ATP-binding protein [Gammaproteobacteria bacterium]MBU2411327.1 ATP-binding protein [Gammaproteobacteria bacterium]